MYVSSGTDEREGLRPRMKAYAKSEDLPRCTEKSFSEGYTMVLYHFLVLLLVLSQSPPQREVDS